LSQSIWTQQGETLSHKNACKEFGLKESEILEAIRENKLQFKENYAHGNPYFKLLKKEVIVLAKEIHGENRLELKKIEFEIKKVKTELNSHKRKISALEKKKAKLLIQQEEIANRK